MIALLIGVLAEPTGHPTLLAGVPGRARSISPAHDTFHTLPDVVSKSGPKRASSAARPAEVCFEQTALARSALTFKTICLFHFGRATGLFLVEPVAPDFRGDWGDSGSVQSTAHQSLWLDVPSQDFQVAARSALTEIGDP
jgi:hypothetical protein